jgi:hypothetical protein
MSTLMLLGGFSGAKGQDLEKISGQKAFDISGSFGIRCMTFHSKGRESYRKPFSWYINGDPVVSIYGITLPFSFTLSEQERSYRQPLNMFGVSPYYKWLTLHLGYRNLTFGQYTLAGHSILGAGFEIAHPKGLNMGFMAGRFNRAVGYEEDPTDTALNYTVIPEYRRTGYAMKLGYATEKSQLLFSMLKASDDEGSIGLPENYGNINIAPAENIVAGISGRKIIKAKFTVDFEYANSVYTNNTQFEPDSLRLTGPGKVLGSHIVTNNSTVNSSAFEASAGFREKSAGVQVRYKRIGDGFQAMGAYYFQNDLRNITFEPWVRFLNNKVRLNASLGIQKQNLDNIEKLKSERVISSVRLNIMPVKIYSVSAHFSNYEIERQRRFARLDSIYDISQTSRSMGVNQNLNILREETMHMFLLGYSFRQMTTKDEVSEYNSDYITHNVNVGYNLSFVRIKTDLMVNYDYNTFEMEGSDNSASGLGAGISQSFFKNVLKVSVNQSTNTQQVDGNDYRKNNKTRIRANFRPGKSKHFFTLTGDFTKSNGLGENMKDYSQQRFDIGYRYRF